MTLYENYNVIAFKSCIQKFTVWRLRKKYSFGGPEVFLRIETDLDFSRPWFSKIKVQIKRPFGLQQTFCRRAGKSRQFALVAQRCNLALQPNLELIQRQTWFFVQSCRARVFTSLYQSAHTKWVKKLFKLYLHFWSMSDYSMPTCPSYFQKLFCLPTHLKHLWKLSLDKSLVF